MSRIGKGLSQAQLALPELSDSYVSLIESDKRVPTPAVIRMLARKLGCSASYLSSGVSEETLEEMRTSLEYAQIALRNGEAAEARNRFAELVADPHLAALPVLAYKARWGYGLACEAAGALEDAIRELSELADITSVEVDTEDWIALHIALSRCYREKGDLTTGVDAAERALARLTRYSSRWSDGTVQLGATLVAAYLERGDIVCARQLADRLIERAEEIGSPAARMAAYWEAAIVAEVRNQYETGVLMAERALALLGEEGDARNLSRLRAAYAGLLLRARPEEAPKAGELLRRSEREMAESSAGEIDHAWCLTELARAEIVLGRPEEALAKVDHAIGLLGDAPRRVGAWALTVRGQAYMRLGRPDEAASAIAEAATRLERMESSHEAARAWFDLAEMLGSASAMEQQRVEAYRSALACAGL